MKQTECWKIESQKYDGKMHRLWTCARPISIDTIVKDEYSPDFLLQIPAFTKVIDASGKEWSSNYDVVACFFSEKHYQVMVLKKTPYTEYYCNSCSIAEVDNLEQVVRFIDFDLDLLVNSGWGMKVVDRQEFEEHAILYGYPVKIINAVESDLLELQRQVRARKGVFAKAFVEALP